MKNISAIGPPVFILLATSAVTMAGCTRAAPPSAAGAPVATTAVFERNEGQAPAGYTFLARHVEHEFAFARDVVRIAVEPAQAIFGMSGAQDAGAQLVDLRFEGGHESQPIGEEPLEGRINDPRRDAANGITNVRTYERV